MGAQQGRLEGAGEGLQAAGGGLEGAHKGEPLDAEGRLQDANGCKEVSFDFSISFFKNNNWPETSKHHEVEVVEENLPIQLHPTILRKVPSGDPFQVDKDLPIQVVRKLPMQVDKDPPIKSRIMSCHVRLQLPVQFQTKDLL